MNSAGAFRVCAHELTKVLKILTLPSDDEPR
jgi:hypothetical protein